MMISRRKNMQICKKCGNQLEDGYKFCDKCGASVDHEQRTERIIPQQQTMASTSVSTASGQMMTTGQLMWIIGGVAAILLLVFVK